jgi:hypothetical protein
LGVVQQSPVIFAVFSFGFRLSLTSLLIMERHWFLFFLTDEDVGNVGQPRPRKIRRYGAEGVSRNASGRT